MKRFNVWGLRQVTRLHDRSAARTPLLHTWQDGVWFRFFGEQALRSHYLPCAVSHSPAASRGHASIRPASVSAANFGAARVGCRGGGRGSAVVGGSAELSPPGKWKLAVEGVCGAR